MSLGEPSFNLPKEVLANISNKIKNTKMSYTESIGFFKLRELVSLHYKTQYKLALPASNIAITAGASASILLVLMTLFNEGDYVAITLPGYPCYRNIIKALSLKPYIIKTKIKDNFQLDSNDIANMPSYVKGIIIESPANPTGVVINNDDLYKIVEICKKKKIKLIADEIYHGISYDLQKPNSVLKYNKNCVVINSFSKYFLMTGWRLGWIIADDKIIENISKIAMNLYLSPSSVSQYTALNVFSHYNYFNKVVKEYQKNRDFLATNLRSIGLKKFFLPQGAFYIFLNISEISDDSYKFCQDMVEDIKVTAAPGIDFDTKRGKKYIRISFAGNRKQLNNAINRLKKWI